MTGLQSREGGVKIDSVVWARDSLTAQRQPRRHSIAALTHCVGLQKFSCVTGMRRVPVAVSQ